VQKLKGIEKEYFGGKGSPGTIQKIVNLIRPHDTLIECFLGNGQLIRNITPATQTIAVDIDPKVIKKWRAINYNWLQLHREDAISFLKNFDFENSGRTVIYMDPPYPLESRKSPKKVYAYEMTHQQHIDLLNVAEDLPADVLISSYPNEFYEEHLCGWRRISFQAHTRHGMAEEWLFTNYEPGHLQHDYRFAGANYRERDRIKKKVRRWIAGLQRLPGQEKRAIFLALADLDEMRETLEAVTPQTTMDPGKEPHQATPEMKAHDREERFICEACNHELPISYSIKTKNYCYMCDPNITMEELLYEKA
jgi:16S rRNA G966 N2-methylase RsmD